MSAPRVLDTSTEMPTTIRSGLRHWFRSLGLMMRFDFARAREWAAMMALVQVLMGAGMALMYSFFYPSVDPMTALYIATGAPTLALIPLGFVMIPQGVGEQKQQGTFDFIWSLPTPRSAQAASTFLLYTALSLPGTLLALLVAVWRFHISLDVSLLIVPAALLCALMAISVGFGTALAVGNPMITNLISNALVFLVLLFSPIVFPASNLPDWLHRAHEILPFYSMAEVIRAGLTTGIVQDTARSFLVLTIWTIVGWALTARIVGRRG